MINCEYFGKCGGCFYYDIDDQTYQKIKENNLAKLNNTNITPIWINLDNKQRRKITLHCHKNNYLGFFAAKSKDLIKINNCQIANDNISNIIEKLQNLITKLPRNFINKISITEFDNCLNLIFNIKKEFDLNNNQKLIKFAYANNCNISSQINNQISTIINLKKNLIKLDETTLEVDGDIFIQASKEGLKKIINVIKNHLKNNDNIKNIADIYCGFGIYSFAIRNLVKNISCFEGSMHMTKLINQNIKLNEVTNIKNFNRDLFLQPLKDNELKAFDLAIINPPRNGASPQIKEIAKSNIKNLIYISCNPKTFFYDAKILVDLGFKLEKLFILDQFYLTKHLELIAIFTK